MGQLELFTGLFGVRRFEGGAVKVDGAKVSDIDLHLTARKQPYAVQVGKRGFADIEVS